MVSLPEEKKKLKCAVYTRKSTEENLERDYNSLDAQREAAENFIASQKMNGWQLLPEHYDDGGFSGGNTERPALKRLLAEGEAGRIDVIVIYKLDRLSRSLLDFMKLVEFFEAHNTSIVSVTQQINTSTSAGRMMINILMTFAQFEREVIAERIRTSVAGAKRRGKYCGGTLVLGYDVDGKNRQLVVNQGEALIIRHIFRRYCEIGSARDVALEMNNEGHKPKSWITRKGKVHNSREFTTGHIYRMLNNPIYIGKVSHKDMTYPGEQEAIVDEETWQKTQRLLAVNTRAESATRNSIENPLKGLLKCGYCGGSMTTTYTKKGNRRYLYMQCAKDSKRAERTCPLRYIAFGDIEEVVLQQLGAVFRTPTLMAQAFEAVRKIQETEGESIHVSRAEIAEAFNSIKGFWEELFPAEKHRLMHLLIEKIIVKNGLMQMELKTCGMSSLVSELNVITEGE